MNFKTKNNSLKTRFLQAFLLFGSFFLWSCINGDDYDPDRVEKIEAEPSFVLPLAYGKLGMKDIINDNDSIALKEYNDKLLYFFYEEVLHSTDIRDLYEIPNKSIIRSYTASANIIVPANTTQEIISKTEIIDFGLAPEQLVEILYKNGTFSYQATTSIAADVEVKIEVPTYNKNGVTLLKTLSLTGLGSKTGSGSENLQEYKADLSTLTPAFNRFPVKFTASVKAGASPVTVTTTNTVSFNVQFEGLDFKLIKGFLGTETVSLPEETVEIGAFGNTFNGANVSIKDAKLKLTVVNEYAVPLSVAFQKLEARRAGASPVLLQIDPASPVTLASPVTIGQNATTTISVTNASDIFNFQPDAFYYKASAQLNPNQITGVNYVADTSKLKVMLTAEVPFYGKASGIVMADTFNIAKLGEDIEDAEVMEAFLKAKIENGFPFDAKVQFYITDEKFVVKDSLLSPAQSGLIVSGKIGTDGSVTESGIYNEMIPLTKTKIDNLLESDKLIVKIKINTTNGTNGSQPDVKIKSDYTIDVNLGIKAHLKLSVKP